MRRHSGLCTFKIGIRKAVHVPSRLLSNEAGLQISEHSLTLPQTGIAPAAARAGDEASHISFVQGVARGLAGGERGAAVGVEDLDRVLRSLLSAIDSPG